MVVPKLGGGRTRRFFKFTPEGKREAETFLQISKVRQENEGTAALSIPETLRIEAVKCERLLKPVNATLTDAVQFFLKHAKPVGGTKSLADAIREILDSKRRAGKRESYIRILGWVLNAFEREFQGRNVNEITRQDVESWVDRIENLTTRKNRIRDLSILFDFCRRRGYCGSNPLENIERPVVSGKRPEIFTVNEAAALLTTAEIYPEFELVPAIAIGLFAGLRMSEIKQLDWCNVDFEHRVIDVDESIAKTRQQRNVDMSDSLAAWLTPHTRTEGQVIPAGFRKKMEQLRKLAGITKWPNNGLRHSFGSYHVAHFQNPNLTALQMGHATTDMLFKHYRNYRIREKDAEAYWKLAPAVTGKNVVAFAVASV
ncbi:MAG: tyrosine-type recombinase/integrase [Chthoniobacterales bacterium]